MKTIAKQDTRIINKLTETNRLLRLQLMVLNRIAKQLEDKK